MKRQSFNFRFWLILLAFFLGAIPLLVHFEQIITAKICGALVTVFFVVLVRYWLSILKSQNKTRNRVVFNANDAFELNAHYKWYVSLSKNQQNIILNRVGVTLGNLVVEESYAQSKLVHSKKFMALNMALYIWLCLDSKASVEEVSLVMLTENSQGVLNGSVYEISYELAFNALINLEYKDIEKVLNAI